MASAGGNDASDYPNPNLSDPTLQQAALLLWASSGPDGRATVSFLNAHQADVSVFAAGDSTAGITINNPVKSIAWIGTDFSGATSQAQVAGLLAHETTHLMQAHTVISQADEIAAYQVQGRVLQSLGTPSNWSSPDAQTNGAKSVANLNRLVQESDIYTQWPYSRPTDLPHLALSGYIEASHALAPAAIVGVSRALSSISGTAGAASSAVSAQLALTAYNANHFASGFTPSFPFLPGWSP